MGRLTKINYTEWNELDKPCIVDVQAREKDVVCKFSSLYLLCQKENECNNIVIFSTTRMKGSEVIRGILFFVLYLYFFNDIMYIRYAGTQKYGTIDRLCKGYADVENGELVRYCKCTGENIANIIDYLGGVR